MNIHDASGSSIAPRPHPRPGDWWAGTLMGVRPTCSCPECRPAVRAWAAERARPREVTHRLPASFWTRQEARLSARMAERRRAFPARILIPAACAGLALLLLLIPVRTAPPSRWAVATAYDAAAEALEKPVLGDLEACGILFTELETTISEEEFL